MLTCTRTSSKETGKLFNSEYSEQAHMTTCTRSNSRRQECGFMKTAVNVPTCTGSCLTKTVKLSHAKLFEDFILSSVFLITCSLGHFERTRMKNNQW